MSEHALSAHVRDAVQVLFSEKLERVASALLVERCSELPLWRDPLDRIRLACIKLSAGVMAFLEEAVELANVDWRDVLVAAGFGDDPTAHERWRPSGVVTYREATARDEAEIARIHAMSWRTAYRGALTDDYLAGPVLEDRQMVWLQRFVDDDPLMHVVVATIEERVIGFACAFAKKDPDLGTLLDNLHVLGDLQGRGIGAELVRAIARWSNARHPGDGLYLGVLEQNTNAQGFYKRLGATDVGGHIWDSPSGAQVPSRDYAWPDITTLLR